MNPSYNDSFGSFSNGGMPVSNGGGMVPNGVPSNGMPVTPSNGAPVVIGAAPEKKSKKWILILAGVIVAVMIIVLVVLLVIPKKGKESNNTVNLSEYMSEYWALASSEDVSSTEVEYYNKLVGLLDKIGENNGGNNTIKLLADDSKELWAYYFVAMTLVYSNADYNYYFENGNLDGFLSEYGYPFAESDDVVMMMFKSTIDAFVGAKKEFYNAVSKTNCVVDDGIDYVCLSDLKSEEINGIQELNSSLNYKEAVQAEKMLKMVVADAKSLNEIIGGTTNE